jgi:hypothetical protein
VQELHLKTRVLDGEAFHTQASLAFWPADAGLGHQAFGARGGTDGVREERAPETVNDPQ